MRILFIILGITISLTLAGCQYTAESEGGPGAYGAEELVDIDFPDAHLTVNERNVVIDVFVADEREEQSLGLGDIEELPTDRGMLFLHDEYDQYQYWMKNVEYPIDILWIKDDVIVDYSENVQPEHTTALPADYKRYQAKQPVNTVLEVNAGFVAKHGIQPGDTVSVLYYQ